MVKVLEFYDVKARKKFKTSKYRITSRMVKGNKRFFAVAISPKTKIEAWRVLPKGFKK